VPYSIEEHRHRFAAWAAGRAANVNGCRFSVQQGKSILEAAGLKELLGDVERLPLPGQMTLRHRSWRNSVKAAAQNEGLAFTHGVAAKLINVYLKAAYVCGGQHTNERVRELHPPIDSVLLDELSVQDVGGRRTEWDVARRVRWSRFNSMQYETVIQNIRLSIPNSPLWKVEKYWRGYQ
jgi:hypothetical protein